MTETDYMLNHDAKEWDRLKHQHHLWRDTLLDHLPRLGIRAGSRILEVGCGSGILLRDLAEIAGSSGRTVGLERDAAAVAHARHTVSVSPELETEVVQGDIFELEAGDLGGPFDLVVARWVLDWLPERREALRRMAEQVKPGGYLLIQDYNYDAIRVEPSQPGLVKLFTTMPKAYAQHGGDAWYTVRLAQEFHRLGWITESVTPICRAGGPESAVFQWAERFFRDYVQHIVDDGLLTQDEGDAAVAGWDTAVTTPGSLFFSPLIVTVVGRRPD